MKEKIKISRQLRDIIHGYIMSDGYVKPGGNLTVDQSKKQEKFVMWLYEKFEPIRTNTPISKVTRYREKTKTYTYSRRFNTRSVLHGFRHMWYKLSLDETGKTQYLKCLPKSIDCFFSPEFLTLWFAGDGTKILGSKGAKFEVTNFSPEDRLKLKKLFKKKYDILVMINRAGKSQTGTNLWTISINSGEYDKFKKLITEIDLIPTLFPYKLH